MFVCTHKSLFGTPVIILSRLWVTKPLGVSAESRVSGCHVVFHAHMAKNGQELGLSVARLLCARDSRKCHTSSKTLHVPVSYIDAQRCESIADYNQRTVRIARKTLCVREAKQHRHHNQICDISLLAKSAYVYTLSKHAWPPKEISANGAALKTDLASA
jgi:hypothetical protein